MNRSWRNKIICFQLKPTWRIVRGLQRGRCAVSGGVSDCAFPSTWRQNYRPAAGIADLSDHLLRINILYFGHRLSTRLVQLVHVLSRRPDGTGGLLLFRLWAFGSTIKIP